MPSLNSVCADDNAERAELADDLARRLREAMDSTDLRCLEQQEDWLLAVTNEACRRCLQEKLQEDADDFSQEVLIDGLLHRLHQPGTVVYHSLCGALEVRRWTTRPVGTRNAPTVVPLELAHGIIERTTPSLARAVAQGYADLPMRNFVRHLEAARRVPPSRSTLERVAKAIGTEARTLIARVEPKLRKTEELPLKAVGINLSLDRTTVPMEEIGEKGRIEVHYRMAYLGTVCITDSEADPHVTRRYAVGAHEGATQLVRRMMADLRHALGQRPNLNIGIVQDGAPELWGLLRDALKAEPTVKKWRETIDRYHLAERLGRILEGLESNPSKRRDRFDRWKKSLDRNDRAMYRIRDWIDQEIRRQDNFRQMDSVVGIYFLRVDRFRYASLKQLGLQQGSGVVEGACKSLVGQRMKRSGQRWSKDGASAVLALRSLSESDRLPRFWNHLAARHRASVKLVA